MRILGCCLVYICWNVYRLVWKDYSFLVIQFVWFCSVGALLARLVHLRQVHPLTLSRRLCEKRQFLRRVPVTPFGVWFLILCFVWKAICSESRSGFVFVFSSVCVVDCVSLKFIVFVSLRRLCFSFRLFASSCLCRQFASIANAVCICDKPLLLRRISFSIANLGNVFITSKHFSRKLYVFNVI